MKFMDYYKDITVKQNTVINPSNLVEEAKAKNVFLIQKIENALDRGELFGMSVEGTLEEIIKGNPFAISMFKKNPTRQNLSEPAQIQFAKDMGDIDLVKPEGHQYVVGGEINKGTKAKKSTNGKSKSIDYLATINGKDYLMTAKVCKQGGGAQDAGKNEMINTIEVYEEYLSKNVETDVNFVLLLDGHFTDTPKLRAEIESHITMTDRVFVMNSNELIELNK